MNLSLADFERWLNGQVAFGISCDVRDRFFHRYFEQKRALCRYFGKPDMLNTLTLDKPFRRVMHTAPMRATVNEIQAAILEARDRSRRRPVITTRVETRHEL